MSNVQTIHRMMDCITARDLDGFRALCEPEYKLWHSYNQVDMNMEAALNALQMMIRVMPDIEYVERDLFDAPGNTIVAQYICRGRTITDKPVALHVMLRVHFSQRGLIRRIEEYVDSGECMVIREAAQAPAAA
jgi:ketosteroid isomerase-like protein